MSPTLQSNIVEFGLDIFKDIESQDSSPLDIRYWNNLILEWSMHRPEFKVNMFRLVDVLPTLRTPSAIADHVRQYLMEPASEIHPALGWLLSLSQSRLGTRLTALAVKEGVRRMASLLIAGDTADAALPELRKMRRNGFAFTVDLLGEFCVCEAEALEYLNRYLSALETLSTVVPSWRESEPLIKGHPGEASPISISVKLTALYSQTNPLNFERSVEILAERLSQIVRRAARCGANVYVDAEDSGNNPIIYETFKRVFGSSEFRDFAYPGVVIQAYSKNAGERVEEMLTFARSRGAPIAIRLVKGAYWDFETVINAQNNWPSPLWEEKRDSDAEFERLTRVLLDNTAICLPAFGSHNIRSLSHACCYAEEKGLSKKDFELQLLFGMAEPIAEAFARRGYLTRMYTPLGELLPGMGYLVRRLLENTSNESFLRHTFFDRSTALELLKDPARLSVLQISTESGPVEETTRTTAPADGALTINLDY